MASFNTTADSIKIRVELEGKKADAWLKKFNKNLKGLEKPAKNVSSSFAKLAKISAVIGAAAIFAKMARDAALLGHSLDLLSRKTGVASTKIYDMQNALKASGGDAKSLTAYLSKMSEGLYGRFNNPAIVNKLAAMGIQAVAGGVEKSPIDILYELSDWAKMQRAGGESEGWIRYQLGYFNVPEEYMTEMMKGGKSFRSYIANAQKEFGSLSKDQVQSLESLNKKWNESVTRFQTSLTSLLAEVATKLEKIIGFFDAFGEFLKQEETIEAVSALFEGLVYVFQFLKDALQGLYNVAKELGEWIYNNTPHSPGMPPTVDEFRAADEAREKSVVLALESISKGRANVPSSARDLFSRLSRAQKTKLREYGESITGNEYQRQQMKYIFGDIETPPESMYPVSISEVAQALRNIGMGDFMYQPTIEIHGVDVNNAEAVSNSVESVLFRGANNMDSILFQNATGGAVVR